MSAPFTDLQSLYRAAEREAVPTRADKRAVRTAILSAGVASSALHAATASGKLISLISGGAKVFTLGQVVAYAGLGAAMGGALAAVGAATAPGETPVAVATHLPTQRAPTQRIAPEKPPVSTPVQSASLPLQGPPAPSAPPKPAQTIRTGKRALPSALTTEERALPTPPAPAMVPRASSSVAQQVPSLIEESRELSAVQSALGAKDASLALQLLDAQDRRFYGGILTQERSAARVIALCIAGRISEADLAKSRFVTAYPGSPWLRRIAVTCTKMAHGK